jgi:magnesium transporter
MIVGAGVYRDGVRVDVDGDVHDLAAACHDGSAFVWLGLFEPSASELNEAAHAFGIHPLAVEDALVNNERPHIDVRGDTLTVVLRPARYVDAAESVVFGQITMLVSPGHILVVRHGDPVPLTTLRQRLEAEPYRLALGPGAVLHEILDVVVEAYFPVLDGIADDIAEVEEQVFSDTKGDRPTQRIYELQREVISFSRNATPLVEVLAELKRLRHPALDERLLPYVADTADDLRRVIDLVAGDRELLRSALEANLTQVGIRQNSDMRKMSAWIAMLAVPTMVAGIYGMNFENMPELRSDHGYFVVLGLIACVCAFLYSKFKRSGWL